MKTSWCNVILNQQSFCCWIKKLCGALQVPNIADIMVAKKIKYWQFSLCLHLPAINLHCCLTCLMCISLKQLLMLKREIGKRKKHGTRIAEMYFSNFIGALFICCSLTLCISCDFHIRFICVVIEFGLFLSHVNEIEQL
jgi:hypothetical protein